MTPGLFDVTTFGAKANGAADDTAAIQSAIDACIGPGDPLKECRRAGGTVYLPAGHYRITAPLRMYSCSFLGFHGEGKSTILQPEGVLPCVLDINGVSSSTFGDFMIEGSNREAVDHAIYYNHDPATSAASCAGNVFERIWLQSVRCKVGLQVGMPGSTAAIDTTTYHDIWMQGQWMQHGPPDPEWWQAGFYVGSDAWGNNLVHNFYGCTSYGWAKGFAASTTNFSLFGGAGGLNGVDFDSDSLSYFTVHAFRSESSRRLFTQGSGPTTVSANISLNDILWASNRLDPDGEMVQWRGTNGTLAIRNLAVTVAAPGVKIAANPLRSLTLLLDGVTCPSSLERFLSGCSAQVDSHVRGFNEQKPNGSLQEATAGMVMSGPVRFLGGGQLESAAGRPAWRLGDTIAALAFRSDIPPPVQPQPPPAPPRARASARIPKGQRTLTVAHGLGAEPRIEDVGIVSPGGNVWLIGLTAKTLIFQSDAGGGVDFIWSATLRATP